MSDEESAVTPAQQAYLEYVDRATSVGRGGVVSLAQFQQMTADLMTAPPKSERLRALSKLLCLPDQTEG